MSRCPAIALAAGSPTNAGRSPRSGGDADHCRQPVDGAVRRQQLPKQTALSSRGLPLRVGDHRHWVELPGPADALSGLAVAREPGLGACRTPTQFAASLVVHVVSGNDGGAGELGTSEQPRSAMTRLASAQRIVSKTRSRSGTGNPSRLVDAISSRAARQQSTTARP